jgi:RHS repeat-associated protein
LDNEWRQAILEAERDQHFISPHAVDAKARGQFIYDGDGHRVQQVDHSGSQPATTTYTNDNSGLSQVLVSNDGTTQTHNRLGLSLIQQDNGSQTSTLLADGLGSVRVEMVGSTIAGATTYEPYGKLLARSGDSGTVYGYTGEQHDAATGLVYLRARYYNPNLKVFMSRDPFPGWQTVPASQHGYSYVHNNPVNLTDPSGEFVPPALVAGAAACAANPLCLLGGVVVVGAAWIVVGPQVADMLAPVFTDMLYGAERVVGQIARDTRTRADDFLEQCGVIVEAAFQQRSSRIQTNPRPISVDLLPGPQFPRPNQRSNSTIVELGAGDYSNAIAMKLANPSNQVIATNSFDDWELGRLLYQQGKSATDYYQVGFYEGWKRAQKHGLEVGTSKPYENTDVGSGRADLVYTILPYPSTAFQFGRDAARIASYQSGTRIAITAASRMVAIDFENGFRLSRPVARFNEYPGALFGNPGGHTPGQAWEPGPYSTWVYEVP